MGKDPSLKVLSSFIDKASATSIALDIGAEVIDALKEVPMVSAPAA